MKVVIVGDKESGKTATLRKLRDIYTTESNVYQATVGVAYGVLDLGKEKIYLDEVANEEAENRKINKYKDVVIYCVDESKPFNIDYYNRINTKITESKCQVILVKHKNNAADVADPATVAAISQYFPESESFESNPDDATANGLRSIFEGIIAKRNQAANNELANDGASVDTYDDTDESDIISTPKFPKSYQTFFTPKTKKGEVAAPVDHVQATRALLSDYADKGFWYGHFNRHYRPQVKAILNDTSITKLEELIDAVKSIVKTNGSLNARIEYIEAMQTDSTKVQYK